MRRFPHRDLMRGHWAQRAAITLLVGLLLVLVASVHRGVSLLGAIPAGGGNWKEGETGHLGSRFIRSSSGKSELTSVEVLRNVRPRPGCLLRLP